MRHNEAPAFPRLIKDAHHHLENEDGMSLRDWFAGQAIAALILRVDTLGTNRDARDRAEIAYLYADALLGVRDEPR